MAPVSSPACPVCRQRGATGIRRVEAYAVLGCSNCGLHYSDPMTPADDDWYAGEGDYRRCLGEAAAETLSRVYRSRLDEDSPDIQWLGPNHLAFLAARPNAGGRLLDVGCGEGTFLRYALRSYDVDGIELDERAVERARSALGDRVRRVTVEQLAGEERNARYDVVTLFEVLEHVADPLGTLRTCRALLRPGGFLVLSVPNRHRPRADDDPVDWPPNHLTRWTERALRMALESAGFDIDTLHARKSSRYGYWEAAWLLPGRFPGAFRRLGGSEVGRGVLLRRLAGLAWLPLWPAYALTRRPTYGLFAVAAR
jgi:SAM-dependent methyltransferase